MSIERAIPNKGARLMKLMSLEDELEAFTRTTRYFQHPLGIRYTDGVHYLAERALRSAFSSHVYLEESVRLRTS